MFIAVAISELQRPQEKRFQESLEERDVIFYFCFSSKKNVIPGGGGGHSLIWPIRGRAAGQGMVFGLLCPEQGILFYANLS